MERRDIEDLRERVSCVVVLARACFALDRGESTRGAMKFRRGGDVVIVNHGGRGWWDPKSVTKGDVFRLLGHIEKLGFPEALVRVQSLSGLPGPEVAITPRRRKLGWDAGVAERWSARRPLWRGASGWTYLAQDRAIPAGIIAAATAQGLLRQGPWGSVWMRHADYAGAVVGWEERGAAWRGFATGGHKTAFTFGSAAAARSGPSQSRVSSRAQRAMTDSPTRHRRSGSEDDRSQRQRPTGGWADR